MRSSVTYRTPLALALGHAEPGHVLVAEQDGAPVGAPLAGHHLGELALPVPVDTRDADHLAGPQLERDAVEADLLRLALELQIGDRAAPRGPRSGPRAAPRRPEISTARLNIRGLVPNIIRTISPRQLLLASPAQVGRVDRAHLAPAAKDRHAVAHLDRLVELVGDQHDGEALRLQPLEVAARSSS